MSFRYEREGARISLEVASRPGAGLKLRFAPVLAPGTKILGATLNGKALALETRPAASCVQPAMDIPLSGKDRIEVAFEAMVEILPPVRESQVGDFDSDLKVIRQEFSGQVLKVVVEGLAGGEYSLGLLRPDRIQAVVGADLQGENLVLRIPEGKEPGFTRHEILINTR